MSNLYLNTTSGYFAPHFRSCDATAAAGEHRQPRSPQAPVAANIMSRPVTLGGTSNGRPASSAKQYNRADSIPLPCGSLIDPGSSPLKRHYLLQALIDVLAIGSAILLVTSVALSIPLSLFLIFFCQF